MSIRATPSKAPSAYDPARAIGPSSASPEVAIRTRANVGRPVCAAQRIWSSPVSSPEAAITIEATSSSNLGGKIPGASCASVIPAATRGTPAIAPRQAAPGDRAAERAGDEARQHGQGEPGVVEVDRCQQDDDVREP